MESEGLKSSELADNIGVNRATISHILSGRNKPSIDMLEKILSIYPNLNLNWLITGFGTMHINESTREIKEINKVMVFYKDSSYDELTN